MIRIRSIHPTPQQVRCARAEPHAGRAEPADGVREFEIDYQDCTYLLRIVPRGKAPVHP